MASKEIKSKNGDEAQSSVHFSDNVKDDKVPSSVQRMKNELGNVIGLAEQLSRVKTLDRDKSEHNEKIQEVWSEILDLASDPINFMHKEKEYRILVQTLEMCYSNVNALPKIAEIAREGCSKIKELCIDVSYDIEEVLLDIELSAVENIGKDDSSSSVDSNSLVEDNDGKVIDKINEMLTAYNTKANQLLEGVIDGIKNIN